jgi:hypothetical protein
MPFGIEKRKGIRPEALAGKNPLSTPRRQKLSPSDSSARGKPRREGVTLEGCGHAIPEPCRAQILKSPS